MADNKKLDTAIYSYPYMLSTEAQRFPCGARPMLKPRAWLFAVAACLSAVANHAVAQSGQWQVTILTATSAGWMETKGTATISPDFSQIYVKDTRNMNREVYRGALKEGTWSGTRSVINTEKLGEPVSGQYSQRTIERYRVETLILTNGTSSANFIRAEPVQ